MARSVIVLVSTSYQSCCSCWTRTLATMFRSVVALGLTACLAACHSVRAQPEVSEVMIENPVLNGRDFDAELTFSWPVDGLPPNGAPLQTEPFPLLVDDAGTR